MIDQWQTDMDISYFLIQPLISSIKTGNIWHDCAFISIVLLCLTFVTKTMTRLIEFIIRWMDSVRWHRVTASYTFDVLIDTSNYAANKMQVSHILIQEVETAIYLAFCIHDVSRDGEARIYFPLLRCPMNTLAFFVAFTRTVSMFARQCISPALLLHWMRYLIIWWRIRTNQSNYLN